MMKNYKKKKNITKKFNNVLWMSHGRRRYICFVHVLFFLQCRINKILLHKYIPNFVYLLLLVQLLQIFEYIKGHCLKTIYSSCETRMYDFFSIFLSEILRTTFWVLPIQN